VFLTRNGGTNWVDVTPKDMVKFTRISSIDASRFGECIAYVAGNRFQLDDNRPHLWKTADCGAHWTRIDTGIAASEFTRVLREDPAKRGLLVAGTERGVWFSPNDGANWRRLQLNLPIVPIHDLIFKQGDIVVATHGRSFYVMDDISTLEQMTDAVVASNAQLFKPRDQYRVNFGGGRGGGGGGGAGGSAEVTPQNAPLHPVGQNPPAGVQIQYWLKSPNQEVTLEVMDAAGKLVNSFTSKPDAAAVADSIRRASAAPGAPPPEDDPFTRVAPAPRAPNKAGVNTFAWNMRYPDATSFPGMILWAANTTGPFVPPGTYSVRLSVRGATVGTASFKLMADPRIKATLADWQEQARVALQIRDKFSEANDAVKDVRFVKSELQDRDTKLPAQQRGAFASLAVPFGTELAEVEDSLYQTRNRSGQDPLNYPIRLNNRIGGLMGVVSSANGRPTQQTYGVLKGLSAELDREITRLKKSMNTNLPKINALLRAAGLPEIQPKARGPIA
jgi:hypothetical protein